MDDLNLYLDRDEMPSFEEWVRDNYPPFGSFNRPNDFVLRELYSLSKTLRNEQLRKNLRSSIMDDLYSGKATGLTTQGLMAKNGFEMSAQEEQFLNNVLAQDAADRANAQAEHMRDTSLTSAANQLQSLGLNAGSVLSTGSAGIGSTSMAQMSQRNLAQERAINEFNQKAQTARTILGLVGGLASAGIYGGAMAASRVAASKLASSTAHSAESITRTYDARGAMTGWTTTSRDWT